MNQRGVIQNLVVEAMTSAGWQQASCQGFPQVESSHTPPPGSHGIANPELSQRSQLELTD